MHSLTEIFIKSYFLRYIGEFPLVSQKLIATIVLTTAIVIGSVVVMAAGVLSSSFLMHSVGNIRSVGVGVYWDQGCTSQATTIDWGNLSPGSTTTVTVYIKNEGSVALDLSMSTDNWNPSSASNYLSLSWNKEGYVLDPGEVVSATFTLTVSSSAGSISTFSFDIVITGVEHQ